MIPIDPSCRPSESGDDPRLRAVVHVDGRDAQAFDGRHIPHIGTPRAHTALRTSASNNGKQVSYVIHPRSHTIGSL